VKLLESGGVWFDCGTSRALLSLLGGYLLISKFSKLLDWTSEEASLKVPVEQDLSASLTAASMPIAAYLDMPPPPP
jgi:hypothetical protein